MRTIASDGCVTGFLRSAFRATRSLLRIVADIVQCGFGHRENAETKQLRTLSKQTSQQDIDSIGLTGVAPQAGFEPATSG